MTLKELLLNGDPIYGVPSASVLDSLYDLSPTIDSLLKALIEAPVFSPRHPPLGYTEMEDKPRNYIMDVPAYTKYIQLMIASRYSKSMSLTVIKELLRNQGFPVSSNGQLGNIFNKIETKLGLADKRSAVTKRTEEYVKKTGKRPHTDTGAAAKGSAAAKAKADIRKAERLKKAAEKRLIRNAASEGKTIKELKRTKKETEALHGNLEEAKAAEETKGNKVLYTPTDRQALFHAAGENLVLYGGAAGGGKSYAMLVDALRYCMYDDYRGLIIRKTSPMLKELIGVSRSLYPKAFPGAKYNKAENVWYFPSGATIEFGYLDKEEDLERYQGLPYAYIGFDEIQHQRSPDGFLYLMSRNRSANPNITCYMRASANPGGAPWVKEMFIDPAEPGTTFWKDGLSYKFIPAALGDNPYLDAPDANGGMSAYRKMLMALPEVKRKQLLEGDWNAGEDSMFAFSRAVHVTSELPPLHWNVIVGMDYGYNDPASCVWAAVNPANGDIHVYDEMELTMTPAQEWGRAVLQREGYMAQQTERVIDWSLFRNTGHTGPGIREQLGRIGIQPRPADRNREAGWNQMHQRLMLNESGTPSLFVHESCRKLIDQLETAKTSDKKPDDIDDRRVTSQGRKHHWDLLDCLRYLLMARPQRESLAHRSLRYKSESNGFDKYRKYFS